MKSIYKKGILAGLFIALIATIYLSGILQYLTLDQLKMYKLMLLEAVSHHYILAALGFICLYIIFQACAIPAAGILTLAGGFLFGTFWGVFYSLIAATIGATCIFLTIRYLVGNLFQKHYKKQLATFNTAMHKYGPYYLLMIRFIILIPFFIVNILAAFTDIPVSTFIWTTFVGIIPASLIYAYAGGQLMRLESPYDIFSWKIIAAFSLLAILALMPVIIQKINKKN